MVKEKSRIKHPPMKLDPASMKESLRRLRRGEFFTPLKNELRPLSPRKPRRLR